MIRVAFVIPTLDQSGAERQLTLLACGLPRDRYAIKVFALNRGGPLADELRDNGIDVEILKKRFRFDPLTYIRLKRGMQDFGPDIVQSFLFAANSYVRFPGICPPKTRIIVSERCVDSWKSAWQLRMDRWLATRMHAMTANSRGVAEFYRSVGVADNLINVIPNGIPKATPSLTKQQARQKLGLPEDAQVIGFVGRLASQKRLGDLIWAFQLLRQTIKDGRLVLIGDGPQRHELRALAEKLDCRDRIVFTGHRSDAYDLAAAFDVFCLLSEFEGMSNSLMEAMSLGLPVAASDIAPNQELVDHEITGLLFPMGVTKDLTMTLKRLFDDGELAARLGVAAKDRMVQQHSVQQLVERHQRLYEKLLLNG